MTYLALIVWVLTLSYLFLPWRLAVRLFARRVSTGDDQFTSDDVDPAPAHVSGSDVPSPGEEDASITGALVSEDALSTDTTDQSEHVPGSSGAGRTPLRIATWVASVAIYGAFLLSSVYLAPRLIAEVLDNEHPMAAVTSQSMYPTLKRGDLVFIRGVDSVSDLNIGDIVAFENENGFAIHRLVSIEGETLITKGDANRGDDGPITFDKVIGRAFSVGGRLAKIPYLGNIPLVFGRTSDSDSETDIPTFFEGEAEGVSEFPSTE